MRNIIIPIICCLIGQLGYAQQDQYHWRVGAWGGLHSYYGDLSTDRILDPNQSLLDFDDINMIAYGLSAEKSLSKAWGLRLMASKGSITANDRAIDWKGNPYTSSDQYGRSLNVKTKFWDASLLFNYYFDNGKLFSDEAFFAPYIGVGIGILNFDPKADLFSDQNQRYHYWTDGTIRSIDQNDPNAGSATIVTQDGDFETDLNVLQTEGKGYSTTTFTLPLALGLKFRLSQRLNLNLESTLYYTGTDFLDDVEAEYPTAYVNLLQEYAANPAHISPVQDRGNNDGVNDIYGFFSLSLHYNFGFKRAAFEAPVFYLGSTRRTSTAPPLIGSTPIEKPIIPPTTKTTPDTVVVVVVDTIMKQVIVEKEVDVIPEKIVVDETPIVIETPIIDEVDVPDVIDEPYREVENNNRVETSSTATETEVLADVKNTNLELIQLREKIHELQLKGVKNDADLDRMYDNLEDLQKELQSVQDYNNSIAIRSNDDYSQPENKAIRNASDNLEAEMAIIREELRKLNAAPTVPSIDQTTFDKLKAENNARIQQLEKELIESKKQTKAAERKATRAKERLDDNGVSYVKNNSRTTTPATKSALPEVAQTPAPVSTVKSSEELLILEQRVATMQRQIDMQNEDKMAAKLLELRVAELEKALQQNALQNNAQKTATNATNQAYVESLRMQNTRLQKDLIEAKAALAQKSVTPPPPPPATTIVKPAPTTVVVAPPAINAIRGFERTNILFNSGQSAVRTEYANQLESVATILRQYPEISVMLAGYTDKSGNPERNLMLSQKRADAVKTFLINRGVSPSRIQTSFFGESSNGTENDPLSRRVEVQLKT